MVMKFTNNATSTLAAGITNSATSLSVASGQGALFPPLSAGDYFYCTLANTSGAIEIVKVTARSTDTFTITRAQDGTTGLAWNTGDKVELRVVAAELNDFAKKDETNLFTQLQSFADPSVDHGQYSAGDSTRRQLHDGRDQLGAGVHKSTSGRNRGVDRRRDDHSRFQRGQQLLRYSRRQPYAREPDQYYGWYFWCDLYYPRWDW